MNSAIEIFKKTFLMESFEKKAHEQTLSGPLTALLLDEYIETCRDFDLTNLQQSWSWRNIHVARGLAKELIDLKGEIKRTLLFKAIQILEKGLHSLGPNRHHDARRQQHLLKILRLFYEKPEYVQALKRVHKPEGHPGAEQLIRETLFLPENTPLNDAHARQATLSALLTRLRQNVGSCFATAPAILIQQDQPLYFLADMSQLLGTGRLKRTYEGKEYSVPLSVSWGVGDLIRPFYLASLGRHPLKVLARAPGLHAALKAAGLIDTESRKEAIKTCEKLLCASFLNKVSENPFETLTADRVLKEVLQSHHHLTEEEITHSLNRVDMGGRMGMVSMYEGKSRLVSRYLEEYEKAKGAFKALTDNALLKAWEFTLASLSEAKANFAKWNFYASLGVQPQEPHGIGESLQTKLKEIVEQFNEEIQVHQSHYDHVFAQVKYLEGRIRRASTENELNWIRAEYQMRRHETRFKEWVISSSVR